MSEVTRLYLNAHSDVSSGAKGVIFELSLSLLPYSEYARSEGARVHRLV